MTALPADIAPAENWLLAEIRKAAGKHVRSATKDPLTELDRPEAIARAASWLENSAPSAVEGAGGDHTTYQVACRVRDFGISEPVCVDLLAEHWNEVKASPPWQPEDLVTKVANAYAYATGGWGGASGFAEFDAVEIEERTKSDDEMGDRGKIYLVPFDEAADKALTQTSKPLIEGLLDQEAMAVVYGASNSGKTFVMLDLAYHVAAGRPWQGRETAAGLVVYIAAEGGRGIYKRFAALRKHYGEGAALALIPCPVNLLSSKADAAAVLTLVAEAEGHYGQPCRMLVVDTLSRALSGGDENTSTDMGAFVKNVDRIRARIKAAIAIVHHSGKDTAKGARGWSGLRAATDTEIEIAERTIKVSKQRDLEPMTDLKFTLDSVEVGRDARDRPVTTCVVRVLTGSEFLQVELSGADAEFLQAFEDAAMAKAIAAGDPAATGTVVTWKEWVTAFDEMRAEDANAKPMAISTLKRRRGTIIESGYVKRVGHNEYASAL